MRKNIILLSLACLALFAGVGCSREPLNSGEKGEGLKITISCGPETKATQDGVGNENLIKTVDVFLFHNLGDPYTYRFHEEPGASTNYTMYIGSSFATDGDYTVFTIVNYPYTNLTELNSEFGTNADDASKKTLAELQALVLSESSRHTFTQGASAPFSLANEENLALVMTGEADGVHVSASSGTNIIGTANIELKRLASKVTMDFYLQDELVNDVKGDGSIIETWTPITEGNAIRAYLCNGNQSIQLGGTGSPSLFDYKPDTNIKSIAGKTGFNAAYSMPAFYTYPESWTKGNANEPYIKLIVQWQLARTTAGGTSTSQKETYYKVMLPATIDAFAANTWYDFKLDITQLGATSESDAVPVVPSYQVADWGTENILISTLVPSYYLSVSEENKNLKFYTDKVEIPFTSSGNVEFSSIDIHITYFVDGTTHHFDNDVVKWASIDNVNNILTINRPIASDFPDEYDISPYTFEITLHLVDEGVSTRYDQVLTAVQYPPLFISFQDTKEGISDGDRNTKPTVLINNYKPNTSGTDSKDVWDDTGNNTRTLANHTHFLGSLPVPSFVLAAASNNNPKLYTITATNIDFELNYDNQIYHAVIGDPRGAITDDYSADGEKLSGGNDSNKLTNYRPAAENTKNYIAPQFMCASSYGKTAAVSYEGAVKRCAAYQEYGYPAGRWRLPTVAEVRFLQELNADSRIPSLFAAATGSQILGYWTAGKELYTTTGFVDLSEGATLAISGDDPPVYQYTKSPEAKPYRGFVRCVYDTWYWGENHSATTNTSWLGYKPNLGDSF